MDNEKMKWLESIGAKAYPEPVKWVYAFPGYEGAFNLSERYVEETTLEALKEQYTVNSEFVKLCLIERKRKEGESMTEKENNILETAEDVIQKLLNNYNSDIKQMSDKDVYNVQMLVVTLGRIRAIRDGKNYVNPPY